MYYKSKLKNAQREEAGQQTFVLLALGIFVLLAMAMFIFIYLGRPSATKIENMAHYTKEAPAPALPPGQLQPN